MEPTLTAWTLSTILALAPATSKGETADQYRERLAGIAEDITAVVEQSAPLPGLTGEQTLALVLATAHQESAGFSYGIDRGTVLGDHGQSFCLMQIRARRGRVPTHDPVARTWTGADLIADRRKCVAAGVAMLRDAMTMCAAKGMKGPALISPYLVGRCKVEPVSTARWHFSRRLAPTASLGKKGRNNAT